MADLRPILVTGAAGGVGAVGRSVVEGLRRAGVPVRAFVRREDGRAEVLRALGAEVVAGDLTRAADVVPAVDGCRRVFFSMSVSPDYLEAAVTMAAVVRALGGVESCVSMSQLTVSQMTLTGRSESRQQRLHWLGEQALDWSGIPVAHIRATVFLQHPFFTDFAAASIAAGGVIRLPFGSGRTSPVAAGDVAAVVLAVLTGAGTHAGRVYELTGPRSQDMYGMAAEYAEALGRPVDYVDVPFDEWLDRDLAPWDLPGHLRDHVVTMARLHARNRYDRLTGDVELLTGRPATSVRDYVAGSPVFRDSAAPSP
ncbi:NAD(P)-dependent oxidoreductase [Microtetraspora sp. NBRC 13810]|uniref:NAD(P)H-binding protein n=1 Tax=Microtetraspora sp. NBRC 13810 TaxID=3030990 RepID=UPI0024A302FD|nr:NAD(P)H-binding protein [Microtetraspora sp. NBRC 13810]GLW07987.1 NAD(P)-dependent oxidoreductase [Microtetraspora sp. NBRC 13810]